jgi:hypothetical protein
MPAEPSGPAARDSSTTRLQIGVPTVQVLRSGGTLLISAAVLSSVVTACLWRFGFSPWLPAGWLGVMGLLVLASWAGETVERVVSLARKHPWWWVGGGLLLCVPVFVRVANVSLAFTHPDEFALAWFSRQYSFTTTNFFGPIPPEPVWTFQSPSLYFVVQKLALAMIGTGPLDVKLSTLPWVLLTAGALFLAARALFRTTVAVLSVAVYAFLAPSVYAESFGLRNTMSTALLLAFFLCALHNYRMPTLGSAVATGVACSLCYLTYPSSYSAAPLIVLFAALSCFYAPVGRVAKSLAISLGTVVIVLLPFMVGAAKSNDFFLQRISQTVPMVGKLLGRDVAQEDVSRSRSQLGANWVANCTYFWRNDVGGAAGFEFGRRALLDPVSVGFLVVGALLAPAMVRRRRELVLVALFVAVSIIGLGFANPPPQVTRLENLFPFVAMLIALPIAGTLRLRSSPTWLRIGLAIALLAVVIGCNLGHLRAAQARDTNPGREDYEDIKVAIFLKEHFPGKEIRVTAFGGFHLEYTLRFFLPRSPIVTNYHDQFLQAFDRGVDCVYVILFPEEFDEKFRRADPEGELITNVSRKYSIFVTRPGT